MPRATDSLDARAARAFRKLNRELVDPDMARELETARGLLRQVLMGEDVLTDKKWK